MHIYSKRLVCLVCCVLGEDVVVFRCINTYRDHDVVSGTVYHLTVRHGICLHIYCSMSVCSQQLQQSYSMKRMQWQPAEELQAIR